MKQSIVGSNSKLGATLLFALVFLSVMMLIALFTMSTISNHTRQIDGYTDIQDTYLGALSGLDASDGESDLAVEEFNMAVGFDYTLDADETIQGKVLESMIQAYDDGLDPDDPDRFDRELTVNSDVQFGSYRYDFTVPGVYDENSVVAVARNVRYGQQSAVSTILLAEREDLSAGAPDGDSPWDNAIFGGSGGSGKLVNGNVSIHGSVHVLGEDLEPTDIAFEVSGTAWVYNNFDGMPSDIEDNLAANTRTIDEDGDGTDDYIGAANGSWDFEGEESLRSKVRVKNGMVSINGTGQLGQSDAEAEAGSRNTLAGIYVNNQWTGNQVSGGVPNPSRVFSDNGHADDYEDYQGNANPAFPRFDDEVTGLDYSLPTCDEYTVTYFDDADTDTYYHQDIIPYNGDVELVPDVAVDAIVASNGFVPSASDDYMHMFAKSDSGVHASFSGSLTTTGVIPKLVLAPPPSTPGEGNFYWNSSLGVGAIDRDAGDNDGGTLSYGDDGYMPTLAELAANTPPDPTLPNIDEPYNCSEDPATLQPDNSGDYYIWWEASSATLVVSGRNLINGNFSILSGGGQKDTLNYQGIGSILVYDGNDDGNGGDVEIQVNMYTTDYPVSNVILVMAEDDLTLGTSSQLEIMGAYYAQDTVSMNKQNEVAGALVGNYFDLGNNVPSIYQIPMLEVAFTDYELSIKPIGDDGGDGGGGGDDTAGNIWFELGVPLTRTD